MLKLERPLVVLDLETTGLDIATARIIEIGMVRLEPGQEEPREFSSLVNPGIPVPPGIEQLTGILTQDLVGARTFRQMVPEVLTFLTGADLGGFNLLGYDLPVLWEELHRAGHALDLKGVRTLDAKVVFHKKQERTLAAAHRFYCGRDLSGAHRAQADAQAAANVLLAQAEQYQDLGTVEELAKFSAQDRRLDLPGKIALNHEDVPVFTFGKYKDVPVKEAQDYARWMLRNDFPANTKEVIRGLISGVEQRSLFEGGKEAVAA